ncbi:MauE/DoxX family redox-associated membrane protein [Echinicola arenosa]|nr:MauE/DoxX family redox-associated membrane protein [Echinicola arenosa]
MKLNYNYSSWLYLASSMLFVALWTFTGIEKLLGFSAFQQAMMNQTIPVVWAKLLAPIIIIAELGLALLLVFKTTKRLGMLFSSLLMTVFTTYIGLVWMGAFPRIPCSCAGFIESMGWEGHFLFNVGFIVLGMFGVMGREP